MSTLIKICLILTISALSFAENQRLLASSNDWPVGTYKSSYGTHRCSEADMIQVPHPNADAAANGQDNNAAYRVYSETTIESFEDHAHMIKGFESQGGECEKDVERFRLKSGRKMRTEKLKVTRCRGRVHGEKSELGSFIWSDWLKNEGNYANNSLRFQMVGPNTVRCMIVPQLIKDCDTVKVMYNGKSICASCKSGKQLNERRQVCY